MSLQSRVTRLVRNVKLDLRYGGFLGGGKKTPFADLGAHNTANADYEALDYFFNPRVIPDIAAPGHVFTDVGCGKGRVLNYWLDHFPGRKLYGIELDPDIAGKVAARLRGYPNVVIRCGDARELVPEDGTIFFLYNSFNGEVLEGFLEAVHAMLQRAARPFVWLVYHNPVHVAVFHADSACEVTPISSPARFHAACLVKIHNRG